MATACRASGATARAHEPKRSTPHGCSAVAHGRRRPPTASALQDRPQKHADGRACGTPGVTAHEVSPAAGRRSATRRVRCSPPVESRPRLAADPGSRPASDPQCLAGCLAGLRPRCLVERGRRGEAHCHQIPGAVGKQRPWHRGAVADAAEFLGESPDVGLHQRLVARLDRRDGRIAALELQRPVARGLAEHDRDLPVRAQILEHETAAAGAHEQRHLAPIGRQAAAHRTHQVRTLRRVAARDVDRNAAVDQRGLVGADRGGRRGAHDRRSVSGPDRAAGPRSTSTANQPPAGAVRRPAPPPSRPPSPRRCRCSARPRRCAPSAACRHHASRAACRPAPPTARCS